MHKQTSQVDLKQLAHKATVDYGFEPDFNSACMKQLQTIEQSPQPASEPNIKDLRNLLWSSIDNIESQDLDQIEYCERLGNGDIRLLVGIADVDAFVRKDTPLDEHAYENCFSIYTGVRTFPMLPTDLSEGLSSLRQDEERQSVVTEMVIGSDGEIKSTDVYLARVLNKAKLAYEPVSDWMDGKGKLPILSTIAGLEEQLRLQDELADRLLEMHRRNGELNVQTIEAQPVVQDGRIMDLTVREQNRARDIIKNFMVSANIALAEFVKAKKTPMIQRVVKEPKKWSRIVDLARDLGYTLPAVPDSIALSQFVAERKKADPERFPDLSLTIVKLLGPGQYVVQDPNNGSEGHFGLAVHDYTHSTAPNRRFPDLVTQRVVKALLRGAQSPYSMADLQAICDHAVDRENSERKLERYMRKAAAAILLSSHIGEVYEGIVTGASEAGTYCRLVTPPAEGRIVRNEQGLDVGDKCKVRLIDADPWKGFIDFERVR